MSTRTRQALEPQFLPLPENRFAQTALSRLHKPTSRSVPPIVFLYGAAGTGKSLLLQRFKNDTVNERTRFSHVSAATFVEMTLEAIDRDLLDDLYDDLRQSDYFLCEDLAAIRKHKHAQRVLATVIDDLTARGSRIVLTASTPPGDIGGITPRLLSRCRSATLAEIAFPGPISREKLISHFARHRQLAMTDEAVIALAGGTPAAPRELAAAVGRLEFLLDDKQPGVVRVPLVERFLSGEVAPPKVALSSIARAVAKYYGVTLAKLRDPSRRRAHVAARQCAMYLARRLSGKTYAEIAGYFGRRNHSTVVHACRRFAAAFSTDAALSDDLHRICAQLGVGHHTVVDNLLTD